MSPTGPQFTLTISPAVVLRSLCIVIGFLVLMHGIVQVATFRFGHDHMMGVVPLFDLNREGNLPTWYSGAVLLITGVMLGVIALGKRRARAPFAGHWALLAVIFLYLSFDELTRLHENWGALVESTLTDWRSRDFLGGALWHLWVVPAGALVLLVGLGYLRFVLQLPHPTRTLFVVSGVGFVCGAIGFEMIDGAYGAVGGRRNLTFEAIIAAEESLEMISIAVFLYAVLGYLGSTYAAIHIETPNARTTEQDVATPFTTLVARPMSIELVSRHAQPATQEDDEPDQDNVRVARHSEHLGIHGAERME